MLFASALSSSLVHADVPAPAPAPTAKPPAAPTKPTQLTAQFFDASNIHLADNSGAINRRAQVQITLTLLPDHKLSGEDAGKRYENNLYENYTTQTQSDWKNTWTGTWTMSADKLTLELTLSSRSCTRWKTHDDRPPKVKLSCQKVDPKVRIECHSETIPVEDLDGKGPKSAKQVAWQCGLAAPAEMGETPLPWVFGTSSCIRAIPFPFGGRRSYQSCKAMP